MRKAVNVMALAAVFFVGILLSGCKTTPVSNSASGPATLNEGQWYTVSSNPLTLDGSGLPPAVSAHASQWVQTWFIQCGDKFITDHIEGATGQMSLSNQVTEYSHVEATMQSLPVPDADKLNGVNKEFQVMWDFSPYRVAKFKNGTRTSTWGAWQDEHQKEGLFINLLSNGKAVITTPYYAEKGLTGKDAHPIPCAAARVDEP